MAGPIDQIVSALMMQQLTGKANVPGFGAPSSALPTSILNQQSFNARPQLPEEINPEPLSPIQRILGALSQALSARGSALGGGPAITPLDDLKARRRGEAERKTGRATQQSLIDSEFQQRNIENTRSAFFGDQKAAQAAGAEQRAAQERLDRENREFAREKELLGIREDQQISAEERESARRRLSLPDEQKAIADEAFDVARRTLSLLDPEKLSPAELERQYRLIVSDRNLDPADKIALRKLFEDAILPKEDPSAYGGGLSVGGVSMDNMGSLARAIQSRGFDVSSLLQGLPRAAIGASKADTLGAGNIVEMMRLLQSGGIDSETILQMLSGSPKTGPSR